MTKAMKYLVVPCVILLLGFGCAKSSQSQVEYGAIKKQYPEYISFVDDIEKWQAQLDSDPERIDSYLTLGLAWKSLADRTRAKAHYAEALRVYEAGSKKAQGKNTVLLTNAAKMATYMENYTLAETYYREAIAAAPGETDYYISLAELYEYQLKKPSADIIALLDEGIKRSVLSGPLKKYKDNYLERVSEK